jgi:hypothetical protein
MIPIYMTTYERTGYFKRSLASLLASDILKGELQIFDDGSVGQDKLDALKDCGHPIIYGERLKTREMFKKILNHFFATSDADCFVLVQDDLEYNREWLNKLIEIKAKVPNLGILTAYDVVKNVDKTKDWAYRNVTVDVMVKGVGGKIRGQNWLVTRPCAEGMASFDVSEIVARTDRRVIDAEKHRGCLYDRIYTEVCLRLGFNIATTVPSYITHFGAETSIGK